MTVTIIAAIDRQGVIGKDGQLPWHLPDDLKRFKQLTMDTVLLMGRKTYDSLPGPLPGREHLVLSRQQQGNVPGGQWVDSFETALALAGDKPLSIVGGAAVYALALPFADSMHLTMVDATVEGDVYFPEWTEDDWQEVSTIDHPTDEKHAYAFRFVSFKR